MKVKDGIYGYEDIGDPVLAELIECPSIQRLKGISMSIPQPYDKRDLQSRFTHSLGVLIVLKRLRCSLEEQVAGLLHDVSHTAFSHVVDWVFGDPQNESFQDDEFSSYIMGTEIPTILSKHDLDIRNIVDLERYSCLEQPSPNLCADRFDYAIKEIAVFEERAKIEKILNDVSNYQGRMVFTSVESARIFSRGYYRCNAENWDSDEGRLRYHVLGDALKRAVSLGLLKKSDFWKTDEEVLQTLNGSNDRDILDRLSLLKKGFHSILPSHNGICLYGKFRYVDPEVLANGETRRYSGFDPIYLRDIRSALLRNRKERRVIFEGAR